MKGKGYLVVIGGLALILVGLWGYMGWYFLVGQKKAEAVVIKEVQTDPLVKKSLSGICHDKDSKYYAGTKNFEAFDTVQLCLDSGGRLPY